MSDEALAMWVVYDRPKDHPTKVIVRKWVIAPPPVSKPIATSEAFWTDSVDEAVGMLERAGWFPMPRDASDDASIVGTWM